MGAGRRYVAGFGTLTAGVACGGGTGGAPGAMSLSSPGTEEYDGTNWTAGGALNTTRNVFGSAGAGTLTAGLLVHGDATEEYNGTDWTESGDLNTDRDEGSSSGTQTSAFYAGGTPFVTNNEQYDGTSWVTAPSIATGRQNKSAGGTTSSGIIFGGTRPPGTPKTNAATEEFTGETTALNLKTITDS